MTLAEALIALKRADRFEAEPGPVRGATLYAFELILRGSLDAHVVRQDPLLAGALACLVRHVHEDPGATAHRRARDGSWNVWSKNPWPGEEFAAPWRTTEILAYSAVLEDYAQRLGSAPEGP